MDEVMKMRYLFKIAVFSFFLTTQAFAFNGDNKLCWDANTETDLAGYKVYVASQSGAVTGVFVPDIINGRDVVLTATPLAPCDSILVPKNKCFGFTHEGLSHL